MVKKHHEVDMEGSAMAPLQPPSFMGSVIRGAIGLAIGGAIVGALAGAALIGGLSSIEALKPAADFLVSQVPLVGDALAGTSSIVSGLLAGGTAGAMLGAPAGMVAGPMHRKNVEAAAKMVEVSQQSFAIGQASGVKKGQELAQQQNEFNNDIAKTGHVEKYLADKSASHEHGAVRGG